MKTQINILKLTIVCLMTMVFNFYIAQAAEVKFFVHGKCVATQTTDKNDRVAGYVPDEDCDYKHFVGWSETNQTELTQIEPNDLFKIFRGNKGHTFTQNTNLYAIYAAPDEGEPLGQSVEKSDAINSMEWFNDVLVGDNTSLRLENAGYGVNYIRLQAGGSAASPSQFVTTTAIRDLQAIKLNYISSGSHTLLVSISTDGINWSDPIQKKMSKEDIVNSKYPEITINLPNMGKYYVKVWVEAVEGKSANLDIYIITYRKVGRQYQYSDYSTDCDNFTPIVIGNTGQVELSDFKLDETKTVIVQAGGVVTADALTTIGNLAIEKVNGQSSQILQAENLTVKDNVYFDVTLNAAAMTWYAIAVPFTVDRLNGLSLPDGSGIPLNDVLVYDGAARASHGANGSAWKYQDDGDLVPGKGYYIMFATPVATVRFTKKADAPLNNENELVQTNVYVSLTGSETDANWNLVANNSLQYVNLGFDKTENSGVIAQTYNPHTDSYEPCAQNATTYLVGTPFFVQVVKEDKINWGVGETHSTLRAPMMTTNRVERFTVELSCKGEMNDRLFVSADENARNEYQIGKDVAKMGISSTIAQMWVENYNTKLCANEAVLYNDQATFSLGVFVPSNGEYTLTITNAPDNAELYLTEDGQPIWNLSKGAYTAEMGKGTHNEYGLMLQVTDAKAPTNLNGLNGSDNAVKFLKNSDIYILRNAKLYNAQGQLVK